MGSRERGGASAAARRGRRGHPRQVRRGLRAAHRTVLRRLARLIPRVATYGASGRLWRPTRDVAAPSRRIGCLDTSPGGGALARVVVDVVLKPEILDPQGQAIVGALGRLGIDGVTDVRQGKHFELEVDDAVDDDTLSRLADTLLANPVIENFSIRRG